MNSSANTFVFVAVGDEHAERAAFALRFLKRYTRNDVVIVCDRTTRKPDHDQVIFASTPTDLTDVQASRFLKTGLHHVLSPAHGLYCYLDSDVLAVSPQAGEIFTQRTGPVTFATDHFATIKRFGRHALVSIADEPPDLAAALALRFGVEVDPGWSLWNGGVFLFDADAGDFMATWHEWTVDILRDPSWADRDQATLAGATWKLGLENQPRMPQAFNWLVRHSGEVGSQLTFRDGVFSYGTQLMHLLHFIHCQGCWEWKAAQSLL